MEIARMETTHRGLLSGILGVIGAARIGISSCAHPKISIQDKLRGSVTPAEANYWMGIAIHVDADYLRKRCWNCERGSKATVDLISKDYIYVTREADMKIRTKV
jgi:hypothetical protein